MSEQPEQPKLTTEELIAQLIKAQEETKRNIDMLAKAIVEVNKKVEAKPTNPSDEGTDALTVLRDIIAPKGGSMEDLARQAESMAKAAEALDRFRSRGLGLGEALLMRAGIRAIYPRYMTKEEIKRAEKTLGVWEALEETGETEHVE